MHGMHTHTHTERDLIYLRHRILEANVICSLCVLCVFYALTDRCRVRALLMIRHKMPGRVVVRACGAFNCNTIVVEFVRRWLDYVVFVVCVCAGAGVVDDATFAPL